MWAVRFSAWIIRSAILTALACFGTVASATTTRVAALGGASDYFDDESNVQRWYGNLPEQTDLALLEPGRLDLDAGHAAWDERVLGEGGGLFLRLADGRNPSTAAIFFSADRPDSGSGGYIGGMAGRQFGAVAAAVSFVGTSHFAEERSLGRYTSRADYSHELGLGLDFRCSDRFRLATAGEIVNTQYGGAESTWESFGLRLRASWRPGDSWTLASLCDYWRDVRAAYSPLLASSGDCDAWQIRVGCGIVREPTPQRRLLFSAEYREGKEGWAMLSFPTRFSNSERDYFVLHCRVGAEARVQPWLTLRFGAEYRRVEEACERWRKFDWDAYSDQEVAGSVRVETPIALGCSVGSGDLTLDLMLADGTPSWAGYLRSENGLADNGHYFGATLAYRY